MSGNDVSNGGCLCGAVRFEATGPLRGVVACHCGQCRKQTGSFVMASGSAKDTTKIEGTDNLSWYSASANAQRGFCKVCGSLLFWQSNGSSSISIMAGAFDDCDSLSMNGHIHCVDKGAFYCIGDDLPKYDGDDGGVLVTYPQKRTR